MAIVCAIGMHRSGTSCLAGALQRAGLYAGKTSQQDPYNPRGNREHLGIRALHDDVLAESEGHWSRPPERLRWTSQHEERRDRLIADFGKHARHWTFKDPRTLLVLPFWRVARTELVFVGIFRHPTPVARSLATRGPMSLSPEHSLCLWLAHNRRLLDLHREEPFPLLCFDAFAERAADDLVRAVEWITRRLDVPLRAAAGREFYERALVHQTDADATRILGAEPTRHAATLLREATGLYEELIARALASR